MPKTELQKSIEAVLKANPCDKTSCKNTNCEMCVNYAEQICSYEIQCQVERKKNISEGLKRRRNHPDNNL
jgi:hypothetical protein